MQRHLFLGILVAALFTLNGCGNKGSLYLPSPPAEPQQAAPQDTDSTAS